MTKQGPRRLKIGVQSRFGPNSTVELEAVFRKKFGVAYCTYWYIILGTFGTLNDHWFGGHK